MRDVLVALHNRLRAIQIAALRQSHSAVIVLEGYDAAGKGGVIRELSYALDPRGFRVHPIGAPTPDEAFRPFLWRFWTRLPAPGQLVIFDRSWYGRVLVERVEHGLSDADYAAAFNAIDDFESQITQHGVPLIKVFLEISESVQRDRLARRASHPEKRWKLTLEDLNALAARPAYEAAVERMLERSQQIPWHRVNAEDKWTCREDVLTRVALHLEHWLDTETTAFHAGVEARLGELRVESYGDSPIIGESR